MKYSKIKNTTLYWSSAFFIFCMSLVFPAMAGDIKGEGFITSVDVEQEIISINGKQFRLSPHIKMRGFAKMHPDLSRLKKGTAVFFILTPGQKGVIRELWNQQD